MAEIKVSQLPEASQINDNDLIMIVQGGTNKKITKENCQFASGDEISIGTTEPSEEEKLWINPNEIPSGSGSYISNVYSDAQDKAYSCHYTNNSDSYSTSEIKTNKTWGSDNEPIYRKVINFTTGSTLNTQLTVAHGISNFKAVVSLDLYVKAWGNVYKCPDSTINQVYMQGSSNVGYVMVSSGLSNMPAYFIIEYIKN